MTALRCIATKLDGGVEILTPMQECIDALREGGAISCALEFRRGFQDWLRREFEVPLPVIAKWRREGVPLEIAMSWEAHKFIACPSWRADLRRDQREVLAWLWVRSLAHGGLDERAAIELISVMGVSNGASDLMIVDRSDIPTDRRFRDQWRRGHNSGMIVFNGDQE